MRRGRHRRSPTRSLEREPSGAGGQDDERTHVTGPLPESVRRDAIDQLAQICCQLEGLRSMVEHEAPSGDILQRCRALRRALRKVERAFLASYIDAYADRASAGWDESTAEVYREILAVLYRYSPGAG